MPKSNYAITKLIGEEYLRAYRMSYGIDYSVVRFFNVYGEGQVPQFVVSKFAEAIREGKEPTVYGDGTQLRSFCHVEDAARGAVGALLSEKANSEIFNIGNDREPITMAQLADKMIALSGKKGIRPRFVEFQDSDREAKREIQKRIPLLSKAQTILRYEPKITLEEGLMRVLEVEKRASREPEQALKA